jgi:hypothetical protein
MRHLACLLQGQASVAPGYAGRQLAMLPHRHNLATNSRHKPYRTDCTRHDNMSSDMPIPRLPPFLQVIHGPPSETPSRPPPLTARTSPHHVHQVREQVPLQSVQREVQ